MNPSKPGNGKPKAWARLSPLTALVSFLLVLGLGITALKGEQLQLPYLPDKITSVWLIEAQLKFEGRERPAKLALQLPAESPMMAVMDESFISRAYGLSILSDDEQPRTATWTLRRAPDKLQSLYYRIEVYQASGSSSLHSNRGRSIPPFPRIPDYQEPLASAIAATLEKARAQSADIHSFASQLLTILSDPRDTNARVIRSSTDRDGWEKLVTEILAGARIPSRVVYGLSLDKPFTHKSLQPWLEVHNGKNWQGFDSRNGDRGYPENFFIWSYDELVPLETRGIRNVELSFSAKRKQIAQTDLASMYQKKVNDAWLGVSLESLPVETQNLYSILLTIPIGALVVAFMRVVVGVPTFGTFMPILIALAFRETQILGGIILFLLIIFIGLTLRIALANLRLLLVPRLAGMLVIVILVMLCISLLSLRLGFEQGLSIALFPMVIMTLTIERMSIIWEERGLQETMKETLGSLLVAIIGFYFMNSPALTHLIFYFPELLLVVLAVCLMLGAYSGYRLSELIRFKDLAGKS